MKRTICWTLGMLTLASMPALAQAKNCSLATLKGKYGYSLEGFVVNPIDHSTHHTATVGLLKYDCKGNFSEVATTSSAEDGEVKELDHEWTYTLNKDCSGSATTTTGKTVYFVTEKSGDTIKFMITNPFVAATCEATRMGSGVFPFDY